MIVHCLCVVAVKFSVESSVESLISRYEIHFDKTRQLTAHNAHMEMFIAENGPTLVRADKLLKRALDKYFIGETKKNQWHFYHTDETRFHQEESLTVRRLKKVKSKLSFVDK